MTLGKLILILVVLGFGYWLFSSTQTPSRGTAEVAAVAATATAVGAATAPSTAAAAATGAAVGAAAATGFWAFLLGGGWFLGEMTFLAWCLLGGIILIPLGIIGWLCELPDDEEAESSARIVGSFVLFGLMLIGLNYGGIPLWNGIRDHGIYFTVAFLGFIGIGVWWSVCKYGWLASDCRKDIAKAVEQFCEKMRLRVADVFVEVDGKTTVRLSSNYKQSWEEFFLHRSDTRRAQLAGATAESPQIVFTRNKARITLWILFWPLSLIRGFFRDVLARALDELIEAMRKVYEAVAKRHAISVVYQEATPASAEAEQTPQRAAPVDRTNG